MKSVLYGGMTRVLTTQVKTPILGGTQKLVVHQHNMVFERTSTKIGGASTHGFFVGGST